MLVAQSCLTLCDPMDYSPLVLCPLSMGFSRQEYWSRLPLSSPGDLRNPGIEPGSPVLQAGSLLSEPSEILRSLHFQLFPESTAFLHLCLPLRLQLSGGLWPSAAVRDSSWASSPLPHVCCIQSSQFNYWHVCLPTQFLLLCKQESHLSSLLSRVL